jgi:hypothetical protein
VAIPINIKVPVPFDFVFPSGCLCLGVEPVTDFDRRGQRDDQARDKESGERLWLVKVLDLDEAAGKFGGSKEVKVKVAAAQQPVPPASMVPGYPPMVEFTELTLTPYVDSQRCGPGQGQHKCKARQAWSMRAVSMIPAQPAGKSRAAA